MEKWQREKSAADFELNERHAVLVSNLVKDPKQILAELDYVAVDIWHAATGIAGEAGELIDAVKKNVVYGKPLDLTNVIEELGDLEFYMQALRSQLNLTREQTLEANIAKLEKRYSARRYSNDAAINRADKEA